jgi:eukaryotic-like serine/threonine-protein kinase
MPVPIGSKLGRYEISSTLGVGGMGAVYLAEDNVLHRKVAIKVLPSSLTTNETRLKRFQREAYTASSLNHPNILTIYEMGFENERHFIVTEFVDGESLGHRKRSGPFTLTEVLEIGIQISSALAAAHEAGIMHRDVKPDNVMIRRDGIVKVLDFGLAKLTGPGEEPNPAVMNPESDITLPGAVMGTARYMSPEQIRCETVDTRTDIWSLGVVLYEMAAGRLPFMGQSTNDVWMAILTSEPLPLRPQTPNAAAELEDIVARALRKDKAQRYQSVSELGQDLRSLKQRLEFEAQSGELIADSGAIHRTDSPPTLAWIGDRSTLNSRNDYRTAPTGENPLVPSKPSRRAIVVSAVAALIAAMIVAFYFGFIRYRRSSNETAITSLAVLPFTNTNKDPDQEYLAEGISESLINRLSQLPGIKVIANSSSLKYKDKDADPTTVASELGVNGIMTGRITQRGDNLVINVELIDGRDRTLIWGEQYQREAKDVLAVQSEITNQVAEKMRLQLTASQQQKVGKQETVKPEAYELLLKGRFHRLREGIEDRKQAANYFERATVVDPSYALAYAELSAVYRSLIGNGALDPREYLPKAAVAAQTALTLDPDLPEAHYALASVKVDMWDWPAAEQGYKRAIELNPNLALAHRYYAMYLSYVGQHQKAFSEIERAKEQDPLSARINSTFCQLLCLARQYDQSIAALKKTIEIDPLNTYAYFLLGNALAAKGSHTEAIDAYEQTIRLGFKTSGAQTALGVEYARTGKRDQAATILKQLQSSKEYVSPAELAVLHDALGDRQRAFASLEAAYQAHDPQLQLLGVDPKFDSLRTDARFTDLLQRVGLVQAQQRG